MNTEIDVSTLEIGESKIISNIDINNIFVKGHKGMEFTFNSVHSNNSDDIEIIRLK